MRNELGRFGSGLLWRMLLPADSFLPAFSPPASGILGVCQNPSALGQAEPEPSTSGTDVCSWRCSTCHRCAGFLWVNREQESSRKKKEKKKKVPG